MDANRWSLYYTFFKVLLDNWLQVPLATYFQIFNVRIPLISPFFSREITYFRHFALRDLTNFDIPRLPVFAIPPEAESVCHRFGTSVFGNWNIDVTIYILVPTKNYYLNQTRHLLPDHNSVYLSSNKY